MEFRPGGMGQREAPALSRAGRAMPEAGQRTACRMVLPRCNAAFAGPGLSGATPGARSRDECMRVLGATGSGLGSRPAVSVADRLPVACAALRRRRARWIVVPRVADELSCQGLQFPAVIPVEAFQEAEAPFPDCRVGQAIGVVSCQHPDRIRVLFMWQIVRSVLPACEAASLSLQWAMVMPVASTMSVSCCAWGGRSPAARRRRCLCMAWRCGRLQKLAWSVR